MHSRRLYFSAICGAVLFAASTRAQITDGDWMSIGGPVSGSGTYWPVYALAIDNAGKLYAGGTFSAVGGVLAGNIAKWSSGTWSVVGSGTNRFDTLGVAALAVDHAGNLYAGGQFDTAGGIAAANIARWNGSAWSALGDVYGTVHALAVDATGNLYAAGVFDSVGTIAAQNIAKWNGNTWTALGTGTNRYLWVSTLAVDRPGNLYAGGIFTAAGGVPVGHIAKWNGSAWSALGSGANGQVNALVIDSSGNVYAGGDFDTAGGVAASHIAKWNGTVWATLGKGIEGSVTSLAFDSSGNLFAGGSFDTAGGIAAKNVARWDGSAWTPLGSGTNDYVRALAVDASDNLYAGGYFTVAGGKASAFVAMCSLNGPPVRAMPHRAVNLSAASPSYDARAGLMRIQLKVAAKVGYRIYTLCGRLEHCTPPRILPAGSHAVVVNTTSLARGGYVLDFRAGSQSLRCRVMLCR